MPNLTDGKVIDGKAMAARLRKAIGEQVAYLQTHHQVTPGLAVVLVGEDPASQVYVRNKARHASEAGMQSFEYRLDASVSEPALLALIDQLNQDPAVNGILVQLPLPAHIGDTRVIQAIVPAKDVDGFHPVNVGQVAINGQGLTPCTPLGCKLLLEHQLGDLSGRHAVVLGRSNIVGKPMANLLLQANCTVTIAHSRTQDLPAICRQADILVAAVGRPGMVKRDWIKPGAVLIDVGINRIEEDGRTRLTGDIDYQAVQDLASAITPVPGGVGPMTIACLLLNTLQASYQQLGLPFPDGLTESAWQAQETPC